MKTVLLASVETGIMNFGDPKYNPGEQILEEITLTYDEMTMTIYPHDRRSGNPMPPVLRKSVLNRQKAR